MRVVVSTIRIVNEIAVLTPDASPKANDGALLVSVE
jgi:hypothetical protein